MRRNVCCYKLVDATMLVLAIGEEVLARVLMQREFVRRSGLAVALTHPLVLQW